MKYEVGQKVSISLSALMVGDSDTDKPDLAFVDSIACDDGHLELYNKWHGFHTGYGRGRFHNHRRIRREV